MSIILRYSLNLLVFNGRSRVVIMQGANLAAFFVFAHLSYSCDASYFLTSGRSEPRCMLSDPRAVVSCWVFRVSGSRLRAPGVVSRQHTQLGQLEPSPLTHLTLGPGPEQ